MQFFVKIRFFVVLLLFGSQQYLKADKIIFDMEGVLARKSNLLFVQEAGVSNFIGFYNPVTLKGRLLEFLHRVQPRDKNSPAVIHDNGVMPQIMCDWLLGVKTTQEIRHTLTKAFEQHADFFHTTGEKRVIQASLQVIFDPERFAKTFVIIPEGLRLLRDLYEEVDENGNKKHELYLLSNFDPETLALLKENEEFAQMFSLFDGIIISGNVKNMKPFAGIFNILFKKYGINPDKQPTIFIDDQEANIEGARALSKKSLFPILCKNNDYKTVREKLERLNLIFKN